MTFQNSSLGLSLSNSKVNDDSQYQFLFASPNSTYALLEIPLQANYQLTPDKYACGNGYCV